MSTLICRRSLLTFVFSLSTTFLICFSTPSFFSLFLYGLKSHPIFVSVYFIHMFSCFRRNLHSKSLICSLCRHLICGMFIELVIYFLEHLITNLIHSNRHVICFVLRDVFPRSKINIKTFSLTSLLSFLPPYTKKVGFVLGTTPLLYAQFIIISEPIPGTVLARKTIISKISTYTCYYLSPSPHHVRLPFHLNFFNTLYSSCLPKPILTRSNRYNGVAAPLFSLFTLFLLIYES